jgi:1,4-dihydroxy-2-naphthoate octaprenyltransferase
VFLFTVSSILLNEYFDHESGIDLHTRRTQFSGGSGILTQNTLNPSKVYLLGLVTLLFAALIGTYFVIAQGWLVAPIVAAAVISVRFYSTHLLRRGIGELVVGLNGSLVTLHVYFTQTGFFGTRVLVSSISPGILLSCQILLNHFPDVEADAAGGRRTVPIMFGRKTAARIYSVLIALNYVCVIIPVLIKILPITALLVLATVPLALRSISSTLRYYDNTEELLPALRANLLIAMLFPVLEGIGLLVATP